MILGAQRPDPQQLLKEIDSNLTSNSAKSTTRMIINSRRSSRTLISVNYSLGKDKAFTEYTSPPREKGTKMLKLKDQLWIYEPASDRIIQISGNMLRQSVMGSDLSYEDFMEDTELAIAYTAIISGEIKHENRDCWILKLTARKKDTNYYTKTLYVDKERNVPLYEASYAKSGKLLKSMKLSDVRRIGSRWYPHKLQYKDELKDGKGTEFIFENISLDLNIPDHIFNRASIAHYLCTV